MATRRSGARVAPLLSCLALGLAACSDDGALVEPSVEPSVDPGSRENRATDAFMERMELPLVGTRWEAEAFVAPTGYKQVLFSGVDYTLEFGPNEVRVSDGCNAGSGTYAVEGDMLEITGVALTEIACDLSADELAEQALVGTILPSIESFDVRGDRLVLSSFDGSALVFRGQPIGEVVSAVGIDPEYIDGENVPFLVLADSEGGNLSADVPARFVTVDDAGSFEQLWSNAYSRDPAFPVPDVDFDVGSVVAVFSPLRPSLGYDITVDAVVAGDPRPTIRVTTTVPGRNCITAQAVSLPFEFVAVPSVLPAPIFEERTVEGPACD